MDIEAKKALESPYYSEKWIKQRNDLDRLTNFIYRTKTYNELIEKCKEKEKEFISTVTIYNYAIHRWLNLRAHDNCVDILLENGAIKCRDFDREKDFVIYGKEFDLKVTNYPRGLRKTMQDRPIVTREDKNTVISWLYANQSQGARKHLKNRLFVVVGDKLQDRFKMDIIKERLSLFMQYYKDKPFNTITIYDNGNSYDICSELIYIG